MFLFSRHRVETIKFIRLFADFEKSKVNIADNHITIFPNGQQLF